MVKVTVNAGLIVEAGPALTLNRVVEPDSYTVARVPLAASGGANTAVVPLLPDAGSVMLLAIKATLADGKQAVVTVIPKNGANEGTELTVVGSVLVAHAGVLAELVPGGPRTLTLKNPGSAPVTVEVLAGLDA